MYDDHESINGLILGYLLAHGLAVEARILSGDAEEIEHLGYRGAKLIKFQGEEHETCAEAGYLENSGYFLGRFLADSLVCAHNPGKVIAAENRTTMAVEAIRATLAFVEADSNAEYWLGTYVVDGMLLDPVRITAGDAASYARLARIVGEAFHEFSYDGGEWALLNAATTHHVE